MSNQDLIQLLMRHCINEAYRTLVQFPDNGTTLNQIDSMALNAIKRG